MFEETKSAIRKTIDMCKTLFTMKPVEYARLVKIVNSIEPTTKEEIVNKMEVANVDYQTAVSLVIKEKYLNAALNNGFTQEQGLAVLSYAALLQEIEN